MQNLNIKVGNAENGTAARIEACADMRNAVTFAAMNYAMAGVVNEHLILNFDSTQFTVGEGKASSRSKACYTIKHEGKSIKVASDGNSKGSTAFFIKYFLIMSAGGEVSVPVYVIADSAMDAKEYRAEKVPGLGLSVTDSYGYLVFCHTRCCNTKFYDWLVRDVVVKFIDSLRSRYGIEDDGLAWLQCDGEKTQIDVFASNEVLNELSTKDIVVGKPPASTTEITQPCDVGICFKNCKAILDKINVADVSSQKHMLEVLRRILATTSLSDYHRPLAQYGLLRVQLALQTGLNSLNIRDSFKLAGVYPFDLGQILSQCTTKLSAADGLAIATKLPQWSGLIRDRGEISDEVFDKCDIGALSLGSSKDNLVLHRRRAIVVTNPALIQKEVNKKLEAEAQKENEEVRRAAKKAQAAVNKALREERSAAAKARKAAKQASRT